MPRRNIVHIDQTKCDGCGECVPSCAEGAIQLVDGKARLVSDIYCDGLGDCLGHCPQGAITITDREGETLTNGRRTSIWPGLRPRGASRRNVPVRVRPRRASGYRSSRRRLLQGSVGRRKPHRPTW